MHQLTAALEGDIDELIEELISHSMTARLAAELAD
jgi:hypothetical protein